MCPTTWLAVADSVLVIFHPRHVSEESGRWELQQALPFAALRMLFYSA